MAWRWCGVRRVFLCMFMFQYSPGNTVNNATSFYNKAVGESVAEPMKYYDNNVSGSLVLAEEMARAGVFKIVFS